MRLWRDKMVESNVKVSMRDDNGLNCSYAIISKGGASAIIILKDAECGILDYDLLKTPGFEYAHLLLKHYANDAEAYRDFLKLIGKMCKEREDSKYFLNRQKEDNRMVCCGPQGAHAPSEEEKRIYEERYLAFQQFVLKHGMCF